MDFYSHFEKFIWCLCVYTSVYTYICVYTHICVHIHVAQGTVKSMGADGKSSVNAH